MKKEYIIPTVKVVAATSEGLFCVSKINEEGDGEQLSNEGLFENEFEKQQSIWDN